MSTKFRKKPVVIDAFRLGHDHQPDWFTDQKILNKVTTHNIDGRHHGGPDYAVIQTLEGQMRAEFGDYIIRGVKGEIYPCKPDIFVATYAADTGEVPRASISMLLFCPKCGNQHIDHPEPEKGWTNPPHRSHLCEDCGAIWRPADVFTEGVSDLATKGSADTWTRGCAGAEPYPAPTPGVALISTERRRQVQDEGYDRAHDVALDDGELAAAAASYAMSSTGSIQRKTIMRFWPWDVKYWKPGTPLRDLVRAGALIAAEIDRHLRAGEET